MHRPLPPHILLESGEPGSGTQTDFLIGENATTVQNIIGNITGEENQPLESSSLILGDLNLDSASITQNNHNDTNWITSEHIDTISSGGGGTIGGGGCGDGTMARRRKNDTLHGGGNDDFVMEFEWSKETKGGILAAFYYGLTFSQVCYYSLI